MNLPVETSHRPWPMPRQPWALNMGWHDLLFAHWPIRPETLRPYIPAALQLDTFDGAAWLGVVPFRMADVHPHFMPSVPWLSAFPELNLRTYVTIEGKPGVWFFSLDAANPIAVRLARRAFHLPYYDAMMRCEWIGDMVHYRSMRTHHGMPAGLLTARYRPVGAVFHAARGSLEAWLTERYCLYAADRSGTTIWRGNIHHARWPLQPAEAEWERNSLAAPLGIALEGMPLLHFARRIDVVAWLPERVHAS